MLISWDEGHGTGSDRGASGYMNEEKVIREYAPYCIAELERYGHKCVNCTPPNTKMTLNQSLTYRSNHANASGSKLHLCFHVNCFSDANAHGAEIEVGSANGAKYGQSVLTEICKLGFTSRGVKTPGLWMTGSKVNAVSILIEPFFCSNKADCTRYNAQKLGLAIAKGIINIIGGTVKVTPVVKSTETYRVRTSWDNPASQIGCESDYYKAKDIANKNVGYYVYDSKGKCLYTKAVVKPTTTGKIYQVIAGSYAEENNADMQIKSLKEKGIDSFKQIK